MPTPTKTKLTSGHLRCLKALASTRAPMSRQEINKVCARDKNFQTALKWPMWVGAFLGHLNPQTNTRMSKHRGETLYTRGLIKILEVEEEIGNGKSTLFQITPKGIATLKNLAKK